MKIICDTSSNMLAKVDIFKFQLRYFGLTNVIINIPIGNPFPPKVLLSPWNCCLISNVGLPTGRSEVSKTMYYYNFFQCCILYGWVWQ